MKKWISVLGLALALSGQAFAVEQGTLALSNHELVQMVEPLNVINWKVGDAAHYKLSMLLGSGTMDKSVDKEEGNGVWIKQDVNLGPQKEVIEMLLDRATAKILRFKRNGMDQAIPDDKIEIISQDTQEVTVPAGKFMAIHIVAKSEKISKIEVWANPKDTCMEGTIKQVAATGIFGDMTIELTSFTRMP